MSGEKPTPEATTARERRLEAEVAELRRRVEVAERPSPFADLDPRDVRAAVGRERSRRELRWVLYGGIALLFVGMWVYLELVG